MTVIDAASNIRTGENPPYTVEDFLKVYYQFSSTVISTETLQMYIGLANTCIKEARWHDYWNMAMGFFVAHFATMWLQGTADPASGAAAVLSVGQAKGLKVSKSVDGVSVGYDYNTIAQDLDGWAAWKLTIYGQQLATFGKLVGKGNMYVY